jgi:hypothetical protein
MNGSLFLLLLWLIFDNRQTCRSELLEFVRESTALNSMLSQDTFTYLCSKTDSAVHKDFLGLVNFIDLYISRIYIAGEFCERDVQ